MTSSTSHSYPSTQPEAERKPWERTADRVLFAPVAQASFAALQWMLFALFFGWIASIQLISPDFLAEFAFSSFGRMQPLFINTLIYGFGFNLAYAAIFWLMVRLAGAPIAVPASIRIAHAFWNAALLLGLVQILVGDSQPAYLLELPRTVTPLMLLSHAFIACWAVIGFRQSLQRSATIGQILLIAAPFWFGWLFMAAQFMVSWVPAAPAVQSIVSGWYVSGLAHLWFIPLALGAAYYLVPHLSKKPIKNSHMTSWAFWLYALLAPWACGSYLLGGPYPAWVQTITAVASSLVLFPAFLMMLQIVSASGGSGELDARDRLVLRYVWFGMLLLFFYFIAQAVFMAQPVQKTLQFTYFNRGLEWLGLIGAPSLILLGLLQYMLPRVSQVFLNQPFFSKVHFYMTALGVSMAVVGLMLAGYTQGNALGNPETTFSEANVSVTSWLKLYSFAFIPLLIGHLALCLYACKLAGVVIKRALESNNKSSPDSSLNSVIPEQA